MARRLLFQVRDNVAQCVTGPIFGEAREAAAVRAFTDLVNGQAGVIAEHPADYDLLLVGVQDDESGVIDAGRGVELIVSGKSIVANRGDSNAGL